MQFFSLSLLATTLALLPSAFAGEVPHDSIQPLPQITPTSASDRAAIRFQPHMHIGNGCHVYPAIDNQGNWSGGLEPTGAPSAGCKDGRGGQVYARSTWYQGKWAIMYSWYWPKDEISTLIGHRHDWEACVVWIDNPAVANPKILGASPSAHGDFHKYNGVPAADLVGDAVKVQYATTDIRDHSLDLTDKDGDTMNLVTWESLTAAEKNALQGHLWGKANVPFQDSNFMDNLAKAYPF